MTKPSPSAPTPTPPEPTARSKRKVLLVGWDSADWKVINPLLDAGKLPHLEQLIDGGIIGNLATLYPILSPMLWTSIATGKRPMKHGIHGFAEPDPHPTMSIAELGPVSREHVIYRGPSESW